MQTIHLSLEEFGPTAICGVHVTDGSPMVHHTRRAEAVKLARDTRFEVRICTLCLQTKVVML